jgi:transposase
MSRKIYDKKFKARVALEALREEKTLSELSDQYGVNPNVISRWKKEVLEQLPEIFSKKRGKEVKESKQKEEELYKEIGKLKVENEFLKKSTINCWDFRNVV